MSPIGAWELSCNYEHSQFCPSEFKRHGIACPENIEKSCLRRQAEFFAGRILACAGLKRAGADTTQVEMGVHRSPVWPERYTGSISHSHGRCLCILDPTGQFDLGADIEHVFSTQILGEISDDVFDHNEKKLISTSEFHSAEQIATLLFSAKETIFKLVFPRVRRFVDFKDVSACTILENGVVLFRVNRSVHKSIGVGRVIEIQYEFDEDFVTTWAFMERE